MREYDALLMVGNGDYRQLMAHTVQGLATAADWDGL